MIISINGQDQMEYKGNHTAQFSSAEIEDDVLYKWLSLKNSIPKPFNLQLIGQREEGEYLVIRFSGRKRWHNTLLSTRFSNLFKKNYDKKELNHQVQDDQNKDKGGSYADQQNQSYF